jgi:hypothetical protein
MPDSDATTKVADNSAPLLSAQKPRSLILLRRLYQVMLWFFVVTPFFVVLGPGSILCVGPLLIILIATFITGIISLAALRRSRERVTDDGYCVASILMPPIVVAAVSLMLLAVAVVTSGIFPPETVGLDSVRNSLQNYAKSNNGQFPSAGNWCNALGGQSSDWPWTDDREKGAPPSCRFAVNPDAMSLGKNAPSNMVIAFSSAPGWNKAGGPELAVPGRMGWVAVLLGDGSVKLVRPKHVRYLRWNQAEPGPIPESPVALPLVTVSTIWTILLAAMVASVKRHLTGRWGAALVLGVVAAFPGALMGMFSAIALYRGVDVAVYAGVVAGAVSGLLAGVAFWAVLGRRIDSGCSHESLAPYAHIAGAIVGAICAAAVHSILMVAADESSFVRLLGGLGYGICTGVIIGDAAARRMRTLEEEKTILIHQTQNRGQVPFSGQPQEASDAAS